MSILSLLPDWAVRMIRRRRDAKRRYRLALREGFQIHNVISKP